MVLVVEGIVSVGDQRGRTLGFPTANLAIGTEVELADGVYAGVVELEDGTRNVAAVSVGRRPHYYKGGERLVEAYLLDFDGERHGELYGEKIRVVLGQLLRPQRSFGSDEELAEQIARDVETIRALPA